MLYNLYNIYVEVVEFERGLTSKLYKLFGPQGDATRGFQNATARAHVAGLGNRRVDLVCLARRFVDVGACLV